MSTVVPHPDDEAMPDSGSLTLQLTVTLVLCQPLALAAGVTVGMISGGEVSDGGTTFKVKVAGVVLYVPDPESLTLTVIG